MTFRPNLKLASALFMMSASLACAADAGQASRDAETATAVLDLELEELEPGSGRLTYTLTNPGDRSVRVLRWKTALDENPDRLFRVLHDGKEVAYIGNISRRLEPQPSHYVEIRAGESVTAELDLTRLYDLREGGTYEVRAVPLGRGAVLEADSEQTMDATVQLSVSPERGAAGLAALAEADKALRTTYCSAQQRTTLISAQADALDYSDEAAAYYFTEGHDARAQLWFGAQAASGREYIQYLLNQIRDTLLADNINYVCSNLGCGTAAAMVNPLIPNRIQICTEFWPLPLTAAEFSKANTIVHEVSHFFWTGDYGTYGIVDTQALAASYPNVAVNAAESYALYSSHDDLELPE